MARRILRALALIVIITTWLSVGMAPNSSKAARSACTKINQAVTDSGKTTMRSLCLFQYASLITMDRSGNLLVTVGLQAAGETTRAGVVKLSRDGVVLGTFGSHGTRSGQFISPAGVAVDHAGDIYVSDAVLNRVQKFTPSGKFLAVWGASGRNALDYPFGMAFDPKGHLWVADLYGNRIVEYSTSGRYLGSCCKTSRRFPGFIHPSDLQFDTRGDMYVSDHLEGAILKFDRKGNFLAISKPTYGQNEAMALDSHGNAYESASGPAFGTIPKFSPALKHITTIRVGTNSADLVVDRAGDLYITDDAGNRIVKTNSHGKELAAWN